jgi:hypothetical protein
MPEQTKRKGRPPGSKNPPGARVGRKPKLPEEKVSIPLTITVTPAEAIELAEVLSTSGQTQRQALMAGVGAIKASPEYQAKLAEPDPPF